MRDNPSLQCAVCGKWMRLHGVDRATGNSYQRFYGSYELQTGEIFAHDQDVCYRCESKMPGVNVRKDHPMLWP